MHFSYEGYLYNVGSSYCLLIDNIIIKCPVNFITISKYINFFFESVTLSTLISKVQSGFYKYCRILNINFSLQYHNNCNKFFQCPKRRGAFPAQLVSYKYRIYCLYIPICHNTLLYLFVKKGA